MAGRPAMRLAAAAVLLLHAPLVASAATALRPHIVFVMADGESWLCCRWCCRWPSAVGRWPLRCVCCSTAWPVARHTAVDHSHQPRSRAMGHLWFSLRCCSARSGCLLPLLTLSDAARFM